MSCGPNAWRLYCAVVNKFGRRSDPARDVLAIYFDAVEIDLMLGKHQIRTPEIETFNYRRMVKMRGEPA